MLHDTKTCYVHYIFILFVCTVAQSAIVNVEVENVTRSYDGRSIATNVNGPREINTISEHENGLGSLPIIEVTSYESNVRTKARGVRANANINEISNAEAELIFETETYASHNSTSPLVFLPSYGECEAKINFVGTIKPYDIFGTNTIALLSEWNSNGDTNTGTLTISCGTSQLYTSNLSDLTEEMFFVTAPQGGTLTIAVNMRSYSKQEHGTYAFQTYTDTDSQNFHLHVIPGGPDPNHPCEIISIPDRKAHVFDPVNQILYITTQSGTVERYDVTTKELLMPWTIGGDLGGVDVTPNGDTVLVADRSYDTTTGVGYIHRVDALSGIVTTLEFPLYGGQSTFTETGSWDVVAMNNGKAFFTADFVGSAWVPLHELDLATNTITERPSSKFSGFNNIRERTWLFRDANHSIMLGLESDNSGGPVFSYIADTDSFIAGADLGFYPGESSHSIFHSDGSGSISHDGQWLAIEIEPTNEVWILDLALSFIATKLSGIEGGVIFDPYQDLLYGLDTVNDEVVVFDTNSWSEIERIAACEDLLTTHRFDGGVLSFDPLNNTIYVSVNSGILPIKIESTESIEDFETNDFSRFSWEHFGDSYWNITSQENNSGLYSAKAGSITHNNITTLRVTLECNSNDITFYRKVSSESNYDYLKFYIDGVEQGGWSGEQDWDEVSFPVLAGTRTFKWVYSKDGSISDGDDSAWIDDIVFPVTEERQVGGNESMLYHTSNESEFPEQALMRTVTAVKY